MRGRSAKSLANMRCVTRVATAVVTVFCVGCGSSPALQSPTAPTPAPPVAQHVEIAITETLSGGTLGSLVVEVPRFPAVVPVAFLGHLTRQAVVRGSATRVDLIAEAAPFNLAFYRQFARNGFETPGTLQRLRHQPAAITVYLRTVDESGAAVDAASLATVRRVVTPDLIRAFSGGRVTLQAVEQGPEVRSSAPGLVRILWRVTPLAGGGCGQASVGGDVLELVRDRSCGCPGTGQTFPTLVRHEVGHLMGFWHTDAPTDVMYGPRASACDLPLSAREAYHAAIAYQRADGNADPDVDDLTARLPASVRMP